MYQEDVRTTYFIKLECADIEKPLSQLNICRNKFYVYETCNRGPLLIDRKKLEELNFLDEYTI